MVRYSPHIPGQIVSLSLFDDICNYCIDLSGLQSCDQVCLGDHSAAPGVDKVGRGFHTSKESAVERAARGEGPLKAAVTTG